MLIQPILYVYRCYEIRSTGNVAAAAPSLVSLCMLYYNAKLIYSWPYEAALDTVTKWKFAVAQIRKRYGYNRN